MTEPPVPSSSASVQGAAKRACDAAPASSDVTLGPLVYARGYDPNSSRHQLSILVATQEGAAPPDLRVEGASGPAPEVIAVDTLGGHDFWRFDLSVTAGDTCYGVGRLRHTLTLPAPDDDLAVAFVSCNGKEHGDFERPEGERDAMWLRLAARHANAPLSLLIMGGDQIYADAALDAHPDLSRWAEAPPRERLEIDATPEAEAAVTAVFLDRWVRSVRSPSVARLMAEVPSVAMWDDHDIFDGYGSHPAPVQESPLGQMIYRIARRFFRLFQAGGHLPQSPATLSRTLAQPGFAVIAPDLRSERQKRRVMGEAGWRATEEGFARARPGEPVFVLSSVPALGPRLSLVEAVHKLIPGAQRYEDDLRDQWQSRAHRDEWRRFLRLAAGHADETGPVTFLSGEIHLAGRGEMRTPQGTILHQLIASGISHPPPPRVFARALGALGALGEAPLSGHPIRIRTLPGQVRRYAAERNYLLLTRQRGAWQARWDLEHSGMTPALSLPSGPPAASPRSKRDGLEAVAL